MKFPVRPELPTASVGSPQAPTAAVDHSAPSAIRPESTYKSGKVVQTNGATSNFPVCSYPMGRLKPTLVRVSYALARIKKEGLLWSIGEIMRRALLWGAWLLLLPVTCVGHVAGYRRLPVLTERIGHLAAEIDCFLKLSQLGEIRLDGRKYFLLAPSHRVANRCLLRYWSKLLAVVTRPWLCALLDVMTRGPLMKHDIADYVLAIGRSARYGSVNAVWGQRKPILRLDADHRKLGESGLRTMGIPQGAWYVCVHAREGGYSQTDEVVHDYRNVEIESMFPAMREIVSRGGWCIRLGDPTMKSIPQMDGVVDYAHHSVHSPEMDVYLAATCRFFLGNTSGLFLVSSVFGVPSALTNMIPLSSLGFLSNDLNIFKFIRDKSTSRLLTAKEIMHSPIVEYRMSSAYEDAGVEPVSNSMEEIRDLVVEMLERLEGTFIETEEDLALRNAFNTLLRPGDYCHGTTSQVAVTFLRRHRSLFS